MCFCDCVWEREKWSSLRSERTRKIKTNKSSEKGDFFFLLNFYFAMKLGIYFNVMSTAKKKKKGILVKFSFPLMKTYVSDSAKAFQYFQLGNLSRTLRETDFSVIALELGLILEITFSTLLALKVLLCQWCV